MKKLFFLGMAGLLSSLTVSADPVGLETARQIAASYLQQSGEANLVKRAPRTEAKSRSVGATLQQTSPYYIFSRGEGMGYVIVSGDDCLPEVLGYTESGDFDENNLPPQLKGFLDYYAGLVEEAQEKGENLSRKSLAYLNARGPQLRTEVARTDVAPLMTTHWHQESPYNNCSPFMQGTNDRAMTGCVATAGAQVVYYFHKDNPDSLLSTTGTYSYGQAPVTEVYKKGMPLKWDLMLDSYNSTRPSEYDEAVATFTAALGAATHLTYGVKEGDRSTSGQISDLVNTFSSFFRLSGVCEYKSGNYSQTAWEKKIYDELVAGRPMVYTGYNESSGGHAVVVDGYQASKNLFHFNFGWGGQGDGYFTVDDETGMNGFISWQGMVYGIAPKKQNLSASMSLPAKVYLNRTNEVKVSVANHGTLPYSGVYLFANVTGKKPTSLSDAKDSDKTTVLSADGQTTVFRLSAKPTTERMWYFFVADNNMNILATDSAEVQLPQSELWVDKVAIDGSCVTETHGGNDYTVVYNDRATCVVDMRNESDVVYEGTPRLGIYVSEDEGATFTYVGYKSSKAVVGANSSSQVSFSVANTSTCPIEAGKLYQAVMVNPIPSTKTNDSIRYEITDTIARFVLKGSNLDVSGYDNGCLALEGNWDPNAFLTIARKVAYKTATSYDLTKVSHIGSIAPLETNPNALFYVSDGAEAEGVNIISAASAVCEKLVLTPGYDFVPAGEFTAKEVSIDIAQTPNRWYLITVPCNVSVPDGMIARKLNSHSTAGISNRTTNVRELESGQTYIIMTSSEQVQTLSGQDALVRTLPAENADPALVGTFVATDTPDGAFLINDEEAQYFAPVESGTVVEAMRGYFADEKVKSKFRAYSSVTLDPHYLVLGQNISSCYDILSEYRGIVDEQSTADFIDSIAVAENLFTEQTITTASKVKKYAADILEYAESYKLCIADAGADLEVDFTKMITNPSFETGNVSGWKVGGNTAAARSATNVLYKGVGADGDYLLYSFAADSTGVSLSQTVSGLVPGYYRLTAMLGTDHDNEVVMYAGDKSVAVQAHPFGRFYLTEAKIEDIEIMNEETELEIGVRAGRWYKADNFRLVYTGPLKGSVDAVEEVFSSVQKSSVEVATDNGKLILRSSKPLPVSVYGVSGMLVWSGVVDGVVSVKLDSGLYIVGQKKVLVRN
ncbi:MAG: C10 family peptidase [Bacteroides sp.]|nr:C10 family peptidase [Roseburia sp.]MCM1347057.1 C10 family peptidase [Bacteroides sp.]MCM1421739.1 C10 family peptidase [Bacteroides sp.]